MFNPRLFGLLLCGALLSLPLAAAVEVSLNPEGLEIQTKEDFEFLDLTITGPEEVCLQRTFKFGEGLFYAVFDEAGQQLLDGVYTFEINLTRKLTDEEAVGFSNHRRNPHTTC